jgi:hypothetical protein
MPDLSADTRAVVDAIQDLTRLTVALHGSFASKSETIRKLSELSIPASRIAGILAMSVSDVQSALNKAKKRGAADGAPEAKVGRAKVGRAVSSSPTAEAADATRV